MVRREIRLHPRPFAVGVSGAAVYALMTIAQSFVLGKVVDKVVTPRFASGEFSKGAAAAGAVAIIAVGVLKAVAIVTHTPYGMAAKFVLERDASEKDIKRAAQTMADKLEKLVQMHVDQAK